MVGFQTQETQSPLLLKYSGGLHFLLAEGKALICRLALKSLTPAPQTVPPTGRKPKAGVAGL